MMAEGVVPLMGLETALGALKAAQGAPGAPGWRPVPVAEQGALRMLGEAEAKAVLAKAGVAVPRGVSAATLPELAARAGELRRAARAEGYGLCPQDRGGGSAPWPRVAGGQDEMAGAQGYLAEEMVQGAVAEVLLGVRRDPVYGVTVTLGMGGVAAEVLADTVTLVAPVTGAEIDAAMRRLRLYPLLDGYRGRPRADLGAVVEAVAVHARR